MANSAKTIYSLVKLGNWAETTDYLASLEKMTQSLQANPKINETEVAKLNSWIVPVRNLIAAKQPLAMDAANQLAMIASQLTIQSDSKLPLEVAMLDYYGRELEIWSARGNIVKLKGIANKIEQIWHDLRPSIQSESRFVQVQTLEDTLIALLDAANSPAQYNLLLAPLLAEVNNLQQVFLEA
jgi:hypothetical protein